MKTYEFIAHDVEALTLELEECKAQHFTPNLGILFSSTKEDLTSISAIFLNEGIGLVGCSTAGEILNDQVHDGKIVGLFLEMPKTRFELLTNPLPVEIHSMMQLN